MNPSDMSPLARWAWTKSMSYLMDHPDGLTQPLTLGLQHLADMGAIADLDRVAEIYADGHAAGRAEVEAEVIRLEAREVELLEQVAALEAQNKLLRTPRRTRRKPRPAPIDVAAAQQPLPARTVSPAVADSHTTGGAA